MTYLLDTNIISELRRPKPHGAVLAWLDSVTAAQLHLSAITLGELQSGAEKLRRHDPDRANDIERWIDLVCREYDVLPVDAAIFRDWARLMAGKPETFFADTVIAATARQRNLIVVTRNVKDFSSFGVQLCNPFELRS